MVTLLSSSKRLRDRLGGLDELLHHSIQLCKVIFTLLDLGDELLFLLELFLPTLFELHANLVFVFDARGHEVVLGCGGVFGELGKESFDRDERELFVFVTRGLHVSMV
jgi:hypothetical protein